MRQSRLPARYRRAMTLAISAFLILLMLVMIGVSLDVGYVVLVRTQMQSAADRGALVAAANLDRQPDAIVSEATKYAAPPADGAKGVAVLKPEVEFGIWDEQVHTFTKLKAGGNAVRVTTRRDGSSNEGQLFFTRLFGRGHFNATTTAVAMAEPRDIAFVVDLSGSMNDDTEPAWATAALDEQFKVDRTPGSRLMDDVFNDFGFGAFPGELEEIGAPLGITGGEAAYAELTKDNGPLTARNIPNRYRIVPADSEATRKVKAYSWIIDFQIAISMPAALPTPSAAQNFAYWEKYLDYIVRNVSASPPPAGAAQGGTDPQSNSLGLDRTRSQALLMLSSADPALLLAGRVQAESALQGHSRGSIPPNQDAARIDKFNNPNSDTAKALPRSAAQAYRNKIGYLTYVQFMMDHGRDLQPLPGVYTPLSVKSPLCPYHEEQTAGGSFKFPPRAQPEHATRRALIAAIARIKARNATVADPKLQDWVSIIAIDNPPKGGARVAAALSGDYDNAMKVCTTLQASGDKGATTALEAGLVTARKQLSLPRDEGKGRPNARKLIVLITDGYPNVTSTDDVAIEHAMTAHPNPEYYGGAHYNYDAILVEASNLDRRDWDLYAVGLGRGANRDFLDRVARISGTANAEGHAPCVAGSPLRYEDDLSTWLERIVGSGHSRLVQ